MQLSSPRVPHRACLARAAVLAAILASSFLLATLPAEATTAQRIEELLAAYHSPMVGTGQVFLTEGERHGVDPAFLAAIAGAETSFGRYLYSERGDQCTFNAFNWFYGPTWPQSDFGSWEEGIGRVAAGLAGSLYHGDGRYSVLDIAPRYCPDGTAEWITNVTAFMTTLGGDPADTRLGTGHVPSEQRPGRVVLAAPLQLSKDLPRAGASMKATFVLLNEGDVPVAVEGLALSVRGPSTAGSDLYADEPFTLAPGESRRFEASWRVQAEGEWYGWIEIQRDGAPELVAGKEEFSFHVRPPDDRRQQR